MIETLLLILVAGSTMTLGYFLSALSLWIITGLFVIRIGWQRFWALMSRHEIVRAYRRRYVRESHYAAIALLAFLYAGVVLRDYHEDGLQMILAKLTWIASLLWR